MPRVDLSIARDQLVDVLPCHGQFRFQEHLLGQAEPSANMVQGKVVPKTDAVSFPKARFSNQGSPPDASVDDLLAWTFFCAYQPPDETTENTDVPRGPIHTDLANGTKQGILLAGETRDRGFDLVSLPLFFVPSGDAAFEPTTTADAKAVRRYGVLAVEEEAEVPLVYFRL